MTRQDAIYERDRIERKIADLQSALEELEGEVAECLFCKRESDSDVVCMKCIFRINRLLAQGKSIEQIACRDKDAIAILEFVSMELDTTFADADWNYKHGFEAVEKALQRITP